MRTLYPWGIGHWPKQAGWHGDAGDRQSVGRCREIKRGSKTLWLHLLCYHPSHRRLFFVEEAGGKTRVLYRQWLMDDFRFSGRRWKNAVGYSGLKKAPYYQAAVSSILGETTISSLFRCGKAKRNKQVLNLSEKTAKPKWRGKDSVTVKHWPAPACLTIVEHCEDLKFTTIRACWYKRTEIQ